jgi:hypothetical protein
VDERDRLRGAPVWVAPLFVVGLALVYLGERVLEASPTARLVSTALGVVAVLVSTVVRFAPKWRSAGGEQREIERLLGILSVIGASALVVYFATTETGSGWLGISGLARDTRERVLGILTVLWIVLVGVSVVPLLFAEGARLPMRRAERPELRRVKVAAASGLTLVLAAVYGALFVFAADGFDVKADYSYFKTSRPSDSTRKMAESLSEPVSVVAFYPQVNEIKNEVEAYLVELAKGVPNLKVEVVDRLLEPKRAKELRATQDGAIVLSRGSVNETLTIGIDPKVARPKLKTLDRDFQEKLLKLLRSRRVAYLTVGHGELNDGRSEDKERSVRIARTLLEKQNYLVKDLGLVQGLATDVPDDAGIVLVLGPKEPFAPEEIGSLERYKKRGGKLFIALEPEAIATSEAEAAGVSPGEGSPQPESPAPPPAADAGAAPDQPPAPKPGDKPAAPPKPGDKPAAQPKPGDKPAAKPKPGDKPAAPPKPEKPEAKPGDKTPPGEPAAQPAVAANDSGLSALARLVGLEWSSALLANEQQHFRRRYNDSDRTLLATNRFSSHASVSTLSRNSARAGVVAFGAGSLERGSGAVEKVDFTVKSLPATFADANRNYQHDQAEKLSTYNLAAAVSAPAKNGAKPKPPEKKDDPKKPDQGPPPDEMRAFVVADADAVTDLVMANFVGNQVLFLDAVRWLGGEESFAGEVNTEEDVRIEHTKQKDLIWFYASIFGAPMLVGGLGFWYSRRTRRRGGRR